MSDLIELTPPDEAPGPGLGPRWRTLALVAGAVLLLAIGYGARHLSQGAAPEATPTSPAASPYPAITRIGPQVNRDLLLVTVPGWQVSRYYTTDDNPEGPFVDCGYPHLPADNDVLAGSGVIFTRPSAAHPDGPAQLLLQTILLYRPGSAFAGLRDDTPAWLAGTCAGRFTVVAKDFTGEQSYLLEDTQRADGLVRYHALVATGDYLVWLEFTVDPPGDVTFVELTAQRTVDRIQCGGFIPTC